MKNTKELQTTVAPMPMNFNAETLIAKAIDNNVPVETMEKLLAMRRELKAEHAKEEYDKAMATFQGECPTIEKTKAVHTKTGALAYKYAPIESIVDQVKEALKNNGFSYATDMELLNKEGVRVCVKVTHREGHSEKTCMTVPFGVQTNIMSQSQVVAAATTFAKRYAFCNAFGILTGDEDNDAAPQESDRKNQISSGDVKKPEPMINAFQKDKIGKLLIKKGKTIDELKEWLAKVYRVNELDKLTLAQANKIVEKLIALDDYSEEQAIDINEVDAGIAQMQGSDKDDQDPAIIGPH